MIYARAVMRTQRSAGLVYVGGRTGEATGTSNYTVSLTGLTGGIGTQPQAGDLVVIGAKRGYTPVGPVSGYTQVAAGSDGFGVYTKSLTAAETSVTLYGREISDISSNMVCHVWRGAGAVTASFLEAGPGTVVNAPAHTIPAGGVALVVGVSGIFDNMPPPFGPGADLDNRLSIIGNTYYNFGIGIGSKFHSGVYDPAEWFGTTSSNFNWTAYTLAIAPA